MVSANIVRQLLEDIAPAKDQGRPEGAGNGSDTTITDRGDAYVLARLKRDDPDLAAQVIAGECVRCSAVVRPGLYPMAPRCCAMGYIVRYPQDRCCDVLVARVVVEV